MLVRIYRSTDCPTLATLFYHTVHTANAGDYSKAQLDVWATGHVDLAAWDASFLAHTTLVAEEGGAIVGFGDMDETGYLDRLYVRHDCLRKGIATAIVAQLEQMAAAQSATTFTTYASITARPFFQAQGYRVVAENTVVRNTIALTNYHMEKTAPHQGGFGSALDTNDLI